MLLCFLLLYLTGWAVRHVWCLSHWPQVTALRQAYLTGGLWAASNLWGVKVSHELIPWNHSPHDFCCYGSGPSLWSKTAWQKGDQKVHWSCSSNKAMGWGPCHLHSGMGGHTHLHIGSSGKACAACLAAAAELGGWPHNNVSKWVHTVVGED